MKNFALAAAAVSMLVAGSASAADLPARTYTKAPAPVEVWNWTGFYIGGNVGGVWEQGSGTTDFTQSGARPTNPQNNSFSNSAFIGGVHAGYNWQAAQWVLGVEGDWDWTNPKTSFCRQTDALSLACSDNGRGFLTFSERSEWLASLRGRVGYAWDRVMVYGTGGVAWGEIKTDINANCLVNGCGNSTLQINQTASFSTTKAGWVAGVGIEAMLTQNWLLRAEYLHYDLGSISYAAVFPSNNGATPQAASWSRGYQYDVGRVGLSYKFGGPVVAKY